MQLVGKLSQALPFVAVHSTFLSCALLFSSCGDEDRSEAPRDGQDIVERRVSQFRPFSGYRLEDPDCQPRKDAVDLVEGTVRGWNHDAVLEEVVALTDLRTTTESLASPTVSRTTYADAFKRKCDYRKPEGSRCRDDNGNEKMWSFVRSKGPLRLCREQATYDRRSYEGVALTSLHHLEQAAKAYQHNFGEMKDSIELWILPEFVEEYENFSDEDHEKATLLAYVTDNLAYFPGRPAIAVFPENYDSPSKKAGAYWESSFVLAHEYGHHIEAMHTPAELKSLSLRWDPISHGFEYVPERYTPAGQSNGLAGRGASLAKLRGTISEAFADLIAHYTENGSVHSLTGLACLGRNRNVSEGSFGDGTGKVLTVEAADFLFERRSPERDPQTCAPSFHDIHTTGAVVAHAMDRVFAELTKAIPDMEEGSDGDFQRRYALAVDWLATLLPETKDLGQARTDQELLAPLVNAVDKLASRALTQLSLHPGDEAAQVSLKRAVRDIAVEAFPAALK